MSNPDDPTTITIALRDLADQAAPPRFSVDDAWRAGRRRHRSRRQIPAAAAAMSVAAGAALTVTSLAGPARPAPVQLTAWTVAMKPGGSVQVTIRDLRDPAGLQRRLRADGVPATVRFDANPPLRSQRPRRCLNYPVRSGSGVRLWERILQGATTREQTMFTIHPSAIPAGAGLWMNVSPPARHGQGSDLASAMMSLVYASGRCPSGKTTTSPVAGFVLGGR